MSTIQYPPVTHPKPPTTQSASRPGLAVSLLVSRWVLAIVGGISAFVGTFILVGGESQWIGIGGEMSWQVSEIDPLWGWGLLVAGVVCIVAAVIAFRATRGITVEESPGADLAVHAVVFLLVNAFLWIQNVLVSGTIDYALWVTVPWAIGLGVHLLAFLMNRGRASDA